jgi:transposase-like protein
MSILSRPYFQSEKAAFRHLEAVLWPNGPTCPHCGNADAKRITRLAGKAHRIGVHKCNECRKQFTVKVGTVFESAHIPLHKMLQAVHLLASSKKGISSHQLHRTLEITYKSAWFLSHRIREAMRTSGLAPMGGDGSIVEIDETLLGFQAGFGAKTPRHAGQFRNVVLTLVERGGSARSFHIDGTTIGTLMPIIRANVQRETIVMTDEASWYRGMGAEFLSHDTVNHERKEYVRGEISTNTVEGYYSIFKRGMKGVYQHCSEKHLHRYLAEFDFRYSHRVALGVDDGERATRAMKGIQGKRLTYRNPRGKVVPFSRPEVR